MASQEEDIHDEETSGYKLSQPKQSLAEYQQMEAASRRHSIDTAEDDDMVQHDDGKTARQYGRQDQRLLPDGTLKCQQTKRYGRNDSKRGKEHGQQGKTGEDGFTPPHLIITLDSVVSAFVSCHHSSSRIMHCSRNASLVMPTPPPPSPPSHLSPGRDLSVGIAEKPGHSYSHGHSHGHLVVTEADVTELLRLLCFKTNTAMPLHHETLTTTITTITTTNTNTVPPPTDANDESLQRYKESLGLGGGTDLSDPNDPRVCIIHSLAMETEGRDPVIIDLSVPGSEATLKDKPFTIKEGARFTMAATFKVQHEVLSGLRYVQIVKRKGIRVSKDSEMLGSYAPNTDKQPLYTKKFQEDEAPTGMLARGHYVALSSFVDDDKKTHLEFEWSFDIAKDW